MNKRKQTIAALLSAGILGLGTAGTVIASPWGGDNGQRCERHEGRHGGHMHGIFKRLDLTEAQQDQLFQIRYEQRPAVREKMKELRTSRQTLRELATADDYDAGKVRAAAEQQAKIRTDLIVMRTETMHKMLQVLTPEQKQKLAEKRQRHSHSMNRD